MQVRSEVACAGFRRGLCAIYRKVPHSSSYWRLAPGKELQIHCAIEREIRPFVRFANPCVEVVSGK